MDTREHTKKLANDIRTKIYGKEVREALATGIEESGDTSQEARDITENLLDGSYDTGLLNTEIEQRMNNLYSTKGQAMDDLYTQKDTALTDLYENEKAELDNLQADYANRAETLETTYAPRLTEVTTQLAQKAEETDVRKKNVPITEFDISDTLKQQINGNAPINQTLADKVVTPEKTTFFKTGKNIFNKDTIIPNSTIGQLDGSIVVETTYQTGVSDFIRVEPNTDYFTTYDGRRVFYDENKEIIEVVNPESVTPKPFKTPSNAFYMRAVVADSVLEYAQIEKGTERTYYEPYKEFISKERLHLLLEGDEIKRAGVTPEKTSFFKFGKNLFNPNDAVAGRVLDSAIGTIEWGGTTSYVISDYIPVEPNTQYTRNYNHVTLYYDEFKTFMSGVADTTNSTITTPDGCYYVRVSVLNSRIDTYQLEKGEEQTSYEPFREFIPSDKLENGGGGSGGYGVKTVNLLTNAKQTGETKTITLENATTAKILMADVVRGRADFFVSNDQTSWTPLKTTNAETGLVHGSIYTAGTYLCDVAGWTYLKVDTMLLDYTGAVINADVTLMQNSPILSVPSTIHRNPKRPAKINPESTLKADSSNVYFKAGRTEGVLYSIIGTFVKKSTDDGESFSLLFNFGEGNIGRAVDLLNDGTLLVATQNGKLWKSDESETNFTEVLTFTTPTANLSNGFGLHVYENIVLAAEYGSHNPPNNARRAYMSTDHGETFKEIFEGNNFGTYHLHDICYDPYSGIIWLTNGDGEASSNVNYSLDMGETWQQVYEFGKCPNQWTTIIPLPNCVLFVTDNKNTGVWRWDRPTNTVTTATKINIELVFSIYDDYPLAEPIGTRAGYTYGDSAVAYFSFSFFANGRTMPCKIWGTVDGHEFYEIWEYEGDDFIEDSPSGIMSISDPTVNGEIIASYLNPGWNMVRIENPEWT